MFGGWWGKPLFPQNCVYKKPCSLPLIPQFGNHHVSSVWESSCYNQLMLPTDRAFSPHWFRSFQCARSSSMLHRRNLPLQLSSEDFPFENVQIFQTTQHHQGFFGAKDTKPKRQLHLSLGLIKTDGVIFGFLPTL